MSDAQMQLGILLACSFGAYLLLVFILIAERSYRIHGAGSARFTNTNASSNSARKLRGILKAGDEILSPAGRGLYALSLSANRRRKWEELIDDRLKQGVRSTYILISPDHEALAYWQNLVDRFHGKVRVCILNPELASAEDAIEMDRLDRFHPILVVRGDQPVAMWIEHDHPPRSPVAYNIEYVATKDIIDYQRARFDRFLRVLRSLTNPAHCPAHLRELSPSHSDEGISQSYSPSFKIVQNSKRTASL
jgi:hypothetical protein